MFSRITRVINIRNTTLENFDVLIQRPTIWGNPYRSSVYGREEALKLYEEYFVKQRSVYSQLYKLYGKVLGCSCKPMPCHGDFLCKICNSFKVIIAGDRNFQDNDLFVEIVETKLKSKLSNMTIISGGQTGADTLAKVYAKSKGIVNLEFDADWNTHGRAAGPLRNAEMAKIADGCLIFDGGGPGSRSMFNIAKQHGLIARVYKLWER